MASLEEYLTRVSAENAADLHLAVGVPAILRERGKGRLVRIGRAPLTTSEMDSVVDALTRGNATKRVDLARGVPIKTQFIDRSGTPWRVIVAQAQVGTVIGPNVTMRRISSRPPTAEEVGLDHALHVRPLLENDRGLFLVVGPTGSGKTTTLAAMIDLLRKQGKRIVTLEDPIEILYPPQDGLITQREVGRDTPSFEEGVHDALRQDPDVILVGEMRNRDTIRAAVLAALTGHLVLGTLHAGACSEVYDRMLSGFVDAERNDIRRVLDSVLRLVIAQRLAPKMGEDGQPEGVTVRRETLIFEWLGDIRGLAGADLERRIQQVILEKRTGFDNGTF